MNDALLDNELSGFSNFELAPISQIQALSPVKVCLIVVGGLIFLCVVGFGGFSSESEKEEVVGVLDVKDDGGFFSLNVLIPV